MPSFAGLHSEIRAQRAIPAVAMKVAAFLERRPDFAVDAPSAQLPGRVLTGEGFLETLPHRHGTDGAFAARLWRAE